MGRLTQTRLDRAETRALKALMARYELQQVDLARALSVPYFTLNAQLNGTR